MLIFDFQLHAQLVDRASVGRTWNSIRSTLAGILHAPRISPYAHPQNPYHLWILHTLFLPAINQDCRDFQLEWSYHPIDSVDTNLKSPAVRACRTMVYYANMLIGIRISAF
jgi:hypothetical protein